MKDFQKVNIVIRDYFSYAKVAFFVDKYEYLIDQSAARKILSLPITPQDYPKWIELNKYGELLPETYTAFENWFNATTKKNSTRPSATFAEVKHMILGNRKTLTKVDALNAAATRLCDKYNRDKNFFDAIVASIAKNEVTELDYEVPFLSLYEPQLIGTEDFLPKTERQLYKRPKQFKLALYFSVDTPKESLYEMLNEKLEVFQAEYKKHSNTWNWNATKAKDTNTIPRDRDWFWQYHRDGLSYGEIAKEVESKQKFISTSSIIKAIKSYTEFLQF